MTKKIKIHDGIVGALILVSALMAWQFDPRLTFKVQGESYQASTGGKPVQALIAQVAAFW